MANIWQWNSILSFNLSSRYSSANADGTGDLKLQLFRCNLPSTVRFPEPRTLLRVDIRMTGGENGKNLGVNVTEREIKLILNEIKSGSHVSVIEGEKQNKKLLIVNDWQNDQKLVASITNGRIFGLVLNETDVDIINETQPLISFVVANQNAPKEKYMAIIRGFLASLIFDEDRKICIETCRACTDPDLMEYHSCELGSISKIIDGFVAQQLNERETWINLGAYLPALVNILGLNTSDNEILSNLKSEMQGKSGEIIRLVRTLETIGNNELKDVLLFKNYIKSNFI